MDVANTGRFILLIGVGLLVLGGIFLVMSRVPFFGRLPGDIRVENGNFACFAPIVSMCLLSILATVILNAIAWVMSR